jgi:integrase
VHVRDGAAGEAQLRVGQQHQPGPAVRLLTERAGIPYVGLHGFRRTASSIAHNGTKDMLAVAQLLGHKHPDVTAKHYTQAAEDAAERTKEALEEALFGS